MEDINVDKNQQKSREITDNLESKIEINDDKDEVESAVEIVNKFKNLLKTAEILGQILKNHYGTLTRKKKIETIKDIFDAPLRLQGALFEEINKDPDALVRDIENFILNKNSKLSREKIKNFSRKLCFRILGLISTGLIMRSALYVGSEDLKEEISETVENNYTNAYRLIEVATQLTQPGSINIEKIFKLSKDLKENSFSFTILQSLGFYHIHMFHTEIELKQQLSQALKIDIATSRRIDLKSKDSKLH